LGIYSISNTNEDATDVMLKSLQQNKLDATMTSTAVTTMTEAPHYYSTTEETVSKGGEEEEGENDEENFDTKTTNLSSAAEVKRFLQYEPALNPTCKNKRKSSKQSYSEELKGGLKAFPVNTVLDKARKSLKRINRCLLCSLDKHPIACQDISTATCLITDCIEYIVDYPQDDFDK
jgi:hypothetical protein